MAGLVPAIHALLTTIKERKTWMPGTRPGMTTKRLVRVVLRLVSRAALQIHMDILLARKAQKLLDALLAADAGLLVAAERRAQEMLRHLVDPNVSRLDRCGGAVRSGEIIGPNRAGEPVFHLVDLSQHLVLVAPLEHREYRSKNLFLADAH